MSADTASEDQMRLTIYSDNALRLLMYVAAKGGARATIPEIAGAYNMSRGHLVKIAHQLGQAGYLETTRGRSGGVRLGRPAHAIGLGEVVRFTEPDMDIAPCSRPENTECPLRRACRLKAALDRARLAFLAVLDEYTIADLALSPAPIRAALGLAV